MWYWILGHYALLFVLLCLMHTCRTSANCFTQATYPRCKPYGGDTRFNVGWNWHVRCTCPPPSPRPWRVIDGGIQGNRFRSPIHSVFYRHTHTLVCVCTFRVVTDERQCAKYRRLFRYQSLWTTPLKAVWGLRVFQCYLWTRPQSTTDEVATVKFRQAL